MTLNRFQTFDMTGVIWNHSSKTNVTQGKGIVIETKLKLEKITLDFGSFIKRL